MFDKNKPFVVSTKHLFLIKDKIYNKINTKSTTVSSGSLAEGLDLPGSDVDIMLILNDVTVIHDTVPTQFTDEQYV
jgi:hypothetical protein